MTPDDIRQHIELQVVELIKAKLANGTMTEERSQEISKIVLDTLVPGMSMEELYKAIMKIDDAASELSSIVAPFANQYEEGITKKATAQVSEYIKEGKYDAAIKLADDAIRGDVKLRWVGQGSN